MAIVSCPRCGAERVVSEGKKKNCRKCGVQLTSGGGIAQPGGAGPNLVLESAVYENLTVEILTEKRPDLIAEIRGDKLSDESSEKKEVKPPMDYAKMNKAELVTEAERRGYTVEPDITKRELVETLQEDDEQEGK